MSDSKCQLCFNGQGIYVCPRCNICYCSVSCYKSEKHLQCSESFYETCVQEELGLQQNDPSTSLEMMKILKRTHESSPADSLNLDSDDDDPEVDLAERLDNVNLNDSEAVWKKLTPSEQKEFRKLVASGSITTVLPDWEPWWCIKKKKIIDLNNEDSDYKIQSPSISSNIPSLLKLTKKQPSPSVPFMIFNILLSNIFMSRWFKGQHQEMPVEAVSTLFALSATLRSNKIFESVVEAYVDFESDLKNCLWIKHTSDDRTQASEDVIKVIEGPCEEDSLHYILASLSDLNILFHKAISVLKKNQMDFSERFSGPPPKTADLRLTSKRIDYYLSWTVDYGQQLRQVLTQQR